MLKRSYICYYIICMTIPLRTLRIVFLSFMSRKNHVLKGSLYFPAPGSLFGSWPWSWPPALTPNLCLPVLVPNLYLPTLSLNFYLPALAPNLFLPALANNFITSVQPDFAYINLVFSISICPSSQFVLSVWDLNLHLPYYC